MIATLLYRVLNAAFAAILQCYPQMEGVLYDLPEVVEGANLTGYNDRVRVESGSFFERVPSGCDAYLMKHIIHDWSDEHCRTVFSLMRQQLPPVPDDNRRAIAVHE